MTLARLLTRRLGRHPNSHSMYRPSSLSRNIPKPCRRKAVSGAWSAKVCKTATGCSWLLKSAAWTTTPEPPWKHQSFHRRFNQEMPHPASKSSKSTVFQGSSISSSAHLGAKAVRSLPLSTVASSSPCTSTTTTKPITVKDEKRRRIWRNWLLAATLRSWATIEGIIRTSTRARRMDWIERRGCLAGSISTLEAL